MEPEHSDDRHDQDRQRSEPPASRAEQAVFKPPFASEGLEQIRDSHC
jgi:hypothetical protein